MSRSSHRLEYGCNSRGGSAELLASVLPHASFSLDALCEPQRSSAFNFLTGDA